MSTYYEPGAKQDGESSHVPPYTQPMLGASPPPGTSLTSGVTFCSGGGHRLLGQDQRAASDHSSGQPLSLACNLLSTCAELKDSEPRGGPHWLGHGPVESCLLTFELRTSPNPRSEAASFPGATEH